VRLPPEARAALIALAKESGVRLEGNVIKVIDPEGDEAFEAYLDESLAKDRDSRRKRLEITTQVQAQNRELQEAHAALQVALAAAEGAKEAAEQDLSHLQKKTQFKLMHRIVNVALTVVATVGLVATAVYVYALSQNREVEHVGTVWASLIGILLTNSFSILGTIMGVKYASDKSD
jgi:hypothetical protein